MVLEVLFRFSGVQFPGFGVDGRGEVGLHDFKVPGRSNCPGQPLDFFPQEFRGVPLRLFPEARQYRTHAAGGHPELVDGVGGSFPDPGIVGSECLDLFVQVGQ
jgi:hypothetical protein